MFGMNGWYYGDHHGHVWISRMKYAYLCPSMNLPKIAEQTPTRRANTSLPRICISIQDSGMPNNIMGLLTSGSENTGIAIVVGGLGSAEPESEKQDTDAETGTHAIIRWHGTRGN